MNKREKGRNQAQRKGLLIDMRQTKCFRTLQSYITSRGMDNESKSHTQEIIQEGKKDKREDKHHHARMCETNDVDVHSYLGVAIIVVSEE